MLGLDKKRYITRQRHGPYPAGTECWAFRARPDVLTLEYDDGVIIEMHGDYYYAAGLEPSGSVADEEDRLFFTAIEAVIGKR
jgi:hypothetical protein